MKTNPIRKHTPLPWEVEERGNARARLYIESGDHRILEAITIHQEENAAFAVKAANNHYRLLSALKNLLDPFYGDTEGLLAEKEARAIIAECER
jgi:hypothetical protein